MIGFPESPDREGRDLVAPGEDSGRALDGPAGLLVHLMDLPQVVMAQLLHSRGVRLGDGLCALGDDGFEPFGAHDSSHSRTASSPAFQAADDGVPDEVLTALADVENAGSLAVPGVDPFIRLKGSFSPDLVRG